MELLEHPVVQGGVGPLVVALVLGFIFARTRLAWIAIAAGYLTAVALSTGFAFSPLTASRKILLLGILTPVVGIALDFARLQGRRAVAAVIAVVAGILAVWTVASVLVQREGLALYGTALGIALFAGALVALVLHLRTDGLRMGATGLGLGLATGIAAVISASIGFLLFGVSIAASAGAMLLVQVILSRNVTPGFTGALTIGFLAALFATGTLMLAELPWFALPLLLLIPLAATLPVSERLPVIARAAVLSFYAVVAAVIPIAAAWFSARGTFS